MHHLVGLASVILLALSLQSAAAYAALLHRNSSGHWLARSKSVLSEDGYFLIQGGADRGRSNDMTADFPSHEKLWTPGDFLFMGSGIKYKTIVFIKIQLYAVALYVEEGAARRELQRLEREGFFKDRSTDTLCRALVEGRLSKLLQIRLLRDVTYSQFTGEIGRDLRPRLDATGDSSLWTTFADYFKDRDLANSASLLGLVRDDGAFEGGFFAPEVTDFEHVQVSLTFPAAKFSTALLDVYLGTGGIVPEAREQWAKAAQSLLDSE